MVGEVSIKKRREWVFDLSELRTLIGLFRSPSIVKLIMGSSHSKIQGNYSLPGPLHLKLQAKIARFNKMREVFAKAL